MFCAFHSSLLAVEKSFWIEHSNVTHISMSELDTCVKVYSEKVGKGH